MAAKRKVNRSTPNNAVATKKAKVEEKKAANNEIEDDDQDLMGASANYMDDYNDDEEEGDDWEEQTDEDGSDDEEGGSKSKKQKTENDDEDAIAGGELEGLKETAELYKSNIFKLEIDELLQEINVNYDKHKTLMNALHQLKSIFEDIPEGKEELINDCIKKLGKKNKVVAPILQSPPPQDALYKFKFEKPVSVKVVGSYALKTITKLKRPFNVDVAVEMPSSIFQEKDYTNNRYFYKRACYLANLAQAIQKSQKNFSIEFSTFNGDAHRPILIVKPAGDKSDVDFSKTKCTIRIIPSIAQDVFPPYRLAPNRNNIRHSNDNTSDAPTPQYNASILMDTSFSSSLAFLYEHSKNCDGFKDAIMLGRTWLYQRELESNRTGSGFSAFLFAMLMGYLLQGGLPGGGRKLSAGHSSYQLLRGTIDFLSTHDFEKEPVMIGEYDHADFAVDHFRENYAVTIVDPSGTINLAANLTKSGLAQVQYEAKLAMTSFNDTVDRFDTLFLQNVNDIKSRFDNAFTIPVPESPSTYNDIAKSEYPVLIDHFAQSVYNVLSRGLTNRVELVAVQYDAELSWSISNTVSSSPSHIKVGLILNPDNSPRLVDQGPDAQQKEACEAFRAFWGDKAELRRFKDGSIVESVVWETQGYENRTLIVKTIVQHLLEHHFQLEPTLVWTGQQVYPYLHLSKHVPANLFSRQLDVSGFQPVMTAYTQFAKTLRDVDTSLPILINNIYPAAPGLRYTSACVPHPMDFDLAVNYPVTARYIDAMDVIIQLERSTKWPDDLEALQKVKYAFYLKIANEMKSRVGAEAIVVQPTTDANNDNENKLLAQGYLDVYYYGYIFRCHLHVPQESDALKNTINDKKSNDTKKKTQAQEALNAHEYLFHHQQRHTYYVQALCVKYPAYSATVRLMKRWFGAHLLSLQVSEELIELICAHVFLEPHPWQPPVNALTGMTRVLELLATWDWRKGPLVVDIEGEMKEMDRDIISQQFATKKAHITMVIATTKDLDGTRWSNPKPNKAVAARIQMLARASVAALDKTIQSGQNKNIKSLFVTPMQDYHAVIQLKTDRCTRYYQNMKPQQQFLELDEENNILGDTVYAKFDPVIEYLNELERIYGDTVLFFHDQFGGDKIGIVWNPTTTAPKQWKVNLGYNGIPVDMNKDGFLEPAKGKKEVSNLIKPNFDAILREMERLGHGIIESIQQQS
ncbi:Nrap protein [Phascolomyces articulosus]|uniref:U3 small nucleolar RNA-associated protein 22 n=1 Tax=Phascolomyces articulosus TaxID=60185 RepID=A0AAD5PJF5_9FUNG|nr:Nrap protein [Phascolomyces articulosus]